MCQPRRTSFQSLSDQGDIPLHFEQWHEKGVRDQSSHDGRFKTLDVTLYFELVS